MTKAARVQSDALADIDTLPTPVRRRGSSPPSYVDLPIPPTVNSYWQPARHTGGMYKTRAGHEYAKTAYTLAYAAGFRPLDGDVAVQIIWFRKAHCTRATCVDKGSCRHKQPDLDGLIKPTLDALQAAAYHDDNQTADLHISRTVLEGAQRPFLRVSVRQVTYLPKLEELAARSNLAGKDGE